MWGGQERVYDNRQASIVLFKCRTNTLNLNERKRHMGESTKCDLCEEEKEDLKHFILWCPAYEEERRKSDRLQQPYQEDEEELLGSYLFTNENIEETKERILVFWKIREKKRKLKGIK